LVLPSALASTPEAPQVPPPAPMIENCIGPAQQPAKFTPKRTPGALERP
jgi:hypothetical protein